MAASDVQGLMSDAKCFACPGASSTELMELAMLDRASRASGPVSSFVDRAGITDATQLAALTTLFTNAFLNGWWDKCDLIYPFVGGNANAHAQNLKSSNFTITWNGTVTHDANGIKGNGSTGYGATGYNPASSGQLTLNSVHLGAYIRSEPTGSTGCYLGSSDGTNFLNLHNGAIALRFRYSVNDTVLQNQVITSLAFSVCNRIDAINKHLFNGGVDNSSAQASSAIPSVALYVLARNVSGAAANFGNANLAGATAGSGLTFAQYQLMAADWQAFNTALGRQV